MFGIFLSGILKMKIDSSHFVKGYSFGSLNQILLLPRANWAYALLGAGSERALTGARDFIRKWYIDRALYSAAAHRRHDEGLGRARCD
mgnify:CR=1 FL=1